MGGRSDLCPEDALSIAVVTKITIVGSEAMVLAQILKLLILLLS